MKPRLKKHTTMSSKPTSEEELNRLLAGVLTDTTLGRGIRAARALLNPVVPSVSQEEETASYQAKVNRLTFAEATAVTSVTDTGTSSQHRVDSLFIDLTSSGGMESSEGGAMLSARSSGNSTIDSVLDVTPSMEYEIYQFPKSLQELDLICCQRQRGGINACIRTNCKLNHQGPRIPFEAGCIVVTRSSGSVFIDPQMSEKNISVNLLAQLKNFPHTLEIWRELFKVVNAREPGEPPFTADRLVEARAFLNFAKSQTKSPRGKDNQTSPPRAFSFGERSTLFANLVEQATEELENQRLADQQASDKSFEIDKDPSTPTPLLRTGEWSMERRSIV